MRTLALLLRSRRTFSDSHELTINGGRLDTGEPLYVTLEQILTEAARTDQPRWPFGWLNNSKPMETTETEKQRLERLTIGAVRAGLDLEAAKDDVDKVECLTLPWWVIAVLEPDFMAEQGVWYNAYHDGRIEKVPE